MNVSNQAVMGRSQICLVPVRLVNGDGSSGRVEVYYSSTWGTVCDESWDLRDANIVCRQLGFPDAIAANHSAAFGEGSGTIWLNNLGCRSSTTESTLFDCPHTIPEVDECSHSNDAGVICGGTYLFSFHTLLFCIYIMYMA